MDASHLELVSEVDVHKFSFLWTIKHADILMEKNLSFPSTFFDMNKTCAATNYNLRWQLYFVNAHEPDKCSIELRLDPAIFHDQTHSFGYEIEAKIALLNYKNKSVLYSKAPTIAALTKNAYVVKFGNYVAKREIRNYIIDDILQIGCEIFSSSRSLVHTMQDDEHLAKKQKTSHYNQFSSHVSSLLKSEEFSDLVISTPDGEIKAHRNILAARSPVFQSMLRSPMVEKIEGRIEISDFSKETVDDLLQFIYSGSISLIDKNYESLSELYKISHKYEVDKLRKNCSKVLGAKLDFENVVENFKMANLYEDKLLKAQTLSFISKNSKNLVKSEEFKKLKDSQPQVIAEIFINLNE